SCAAHFVFVAQQRQRLGVEHLPGIAAGLGQHGASVFGVSVIAEISAFIYETFAVGIHHQPERIAMPITSAVLAVDVAVVVSVTLPSHRMCTGPLSVRLRTDI